MKYALQRCCTTPVFLRQYETSTNEVLKELGVEIVDIKDFGCCGYPLRNFDQTACVLSSAKNLSLAEERDLNILTFCNCCYSSLKHAGALMKEVPSIRADVDALLRKEGLSYRGTAQVRHILELLHRDIGIEHIKRKITRRFENLKIAIHYGCHILRPQRVVGFGPPGPASVFDELVEATGAQLVEWASQLECCGSPMLGVDDDLSADLAKKKIVSAKDAGADFLCVACPYCQLQFDRLQRIYLAKNGSKFRLPSILFTQLLGLALGLKPDRVGIDRN